MHCSILYYRFLLFLISSPLISLPLSLILSISATVSLSFLLLISSLFLFLPPYFSLSLFPSFNYSLSLYLSFTLTPCPPPSLSLSLPPPYLSFSLPNSLSLNFSPLIPNSSRYQVIVCTCGTAGAIGSLFDHQEMHPLSSHSCE